MDLQRPTLTHTDKTLEVIGAVTGMMGGLLLALKVPESKYGWIFFAISNLMWLAFALRLRFKAMLGMNIVYTCINAIGIYRNLLLPFI